MIIIKCGKCKKKLFKYDKIGMGKIIKVYFSRIHKDYSNQLDDKIICPYCNNSIGIINSNYIKMNQSSFIYTGLKSKK